MKSAGGNVVTVHEHYTRPLLQVDVLFLVVKREENLGSLIRRTGSKRSMLGK